MITALQLQSLRQAIRPVLDLATTEADAALSLEAYDYPANLRNVLRNLDDLIGVGIRDRGPAAAPADICHGQEVPA